MSFLKKYNMDTFDYKKYLKENKLVNEESFDLKVKDFPMEFTLERDINYDSWGVHEDKLYKGTFVKDLILSDHKKAVYVNHEGKQEVTLDEDDIRNLERLGVTLNENKLNEEFNKSLVSDMDNAIKDKTAYLEFTDAIDRLLDDWYMEGYTKNDVIAYMTSILPSN
jgi:hypothetical protein